MFIRGAATGGGGGSDRSDNRWGFGLGRFAVHYGWEAGRGGGGQTLRSGCIRSGSELRHKLRPRVL